MLRRALVATVLVFAPDAISAGEASIEIEGAFDTVIEDATADLAFYERAGIWMVQIRPPGDFKKNHDVEFSVNIFFSRRFTPSVGTFPILFSYLSKKDGLGGSVLVSGEERGIFSHDTKGEATFTSFGESIEGSFAFESFDGSEEPRRAITVKGSFRCPVGKAFR